MFKSSGWHVRLLSKPLEMRSPTFLGSLRLSLIKGVEVH